MFRPLTKKKKGRGKRKKEGGGRGGGGEGGGISHTLHEQNYITEVGVYCTAPKPNITDCQGLGSFTEST